MNEESAGVPPASDRMKTYLGKIATGPEQSQDLTESEAEDAVGLILSGSVSPVRAGVFLIASRMKRETLAENAGFWKALDRTTCKRSANLNELLQVADPFDGFDRVPYFGFYAIPVLAAMGLPSYGHSARSLPPKFGITFEDVLQLHYRVPAGMGLDARVRLLEEFRFGYVDLCQSHPALEGLRQLRTEIVKRTALSTFEKMLRPVQSAGGADYLASGYFHKGYEIPMMAAARLSGFDKTVLGNGAEGTTLFGVHKNARIFILEREKRDQEPREIRLALEEMYSAETARKIRDAYAALKKETARMDFLAELGETALESNSGPAAPLIASQAGVLIHLLGRVANPQAGYDAAEQILARGECRGRLMRYLDSCRRGG
ncbi:MAG: hypothetical protein HZA02_07690 [Nitrospinae bacterium]|nr:hypothetical protein [Nitrospinota bacterium]